MSSQDSEHNQENHSDLSRAYAKLDKPVPSRELDDIVLKNARQALEKSTATNAKKSGWRNLFGLDSPMALAVVFVLCVSLILIFSQEQTLFEESAEVFSESKPDVGYDAVNNTMPALRAEKVIPENVQTESVRSKKEHHRTLNMEEKAMSSSPTVQAPEDHIKQKFDDETLPATAPQGRMATESDAVNPETGKGSVVKEQNDVDTLVKQIKILINKGKIKEAKVKYHKLKKLVSDQQLSEWLSDQEISLLNR